MRPTRLGIHGALFHGLMVLAFYASPYSNLFFLLLAFLTLLLAWGVLAAWRNLRGVAARAEPFAPLPSGAPGTLAVELRAPRRPRHQIGAWLALAGGARAEGRVELLRGEARLELAVPPLPRGRYRVERARVGSAHPFGLVRVERGFPCDAELFVYPAPLVAGGEHGRAGAGHDPAWILGRRERGDLQPSGLRDLRPGDGRRAVHWRASARRGRLVVLEWEGTSERGLEVVLDRRAAPEELEDALAALSTLALAARDAKEGLRLATQGLTASYGDEGRPWADLLRFLAGAEALSACAAPPPSAARDALRLPARGLHG